jgi:uncharacterized membrane protein YhaH (DUF805 family)
LGDFAGEKAMTFSESISSCFENYAVFSGRAPRSEYWWFAVVIAVIDFIVTMADAIVFGTGGHVPVFGLLAAVALLVPSLAVSVRRLHDTDRSAWWLLIAIVPLVGAVMLLVWFCTRGSDGSNNYGSDPLREPLSATALYGAP